MVCNTVLLPAQSSPAQPGVATLGAAETAISLPATPPPSAAAGVFPLSQVHRGLRGVAYTVFEGTQPEAMEVEILGLLHNALGPGQDMILARLVGAKPEYTGVVAGMSGSPVYIDGKLLGALSYRIGQFSKEPIAGITPIAQMFQVRDQPVAPLMGTAVASAALPADSTQNRLLPQLRSPTSGNHAAHRDAAYLQRFQPRGHQALAGQPSRPAA